MTNGIRTIAIGIGVLTSTDYQYDFLTLPPHSLHSVERGGQVHMNCVPEIQFLPQCGHWYLLMAPLIMKCTALR